MFAVCAFEFVFQVSGGLRSFLNDWVYDNIVFAAGAACLARGLALRRGPARRDYPDGLARTAIPLVSHRLRLRRLRRDDVAPAVRRGADDRGGLEELKRSAGTQFDPLVVAAFADVIADRGAPRVALAS